MPEMNEHEFLEKYTKLSETIRANCITMMITNSIHTDDLKKAESNPSVILFMNKPIDKEKLGLIEHDFSSKKQVIYKRLASKKFLLHHTIRLLKPISIPKNESNLMIRLLLFFYEYAKDSGNPSNIAHFFRILICTLFFIRAQPQF